LTPIVILFCFCAPKEDEHERWLIVLFFCFVSMHLKKMMMRWAGSLLFSFYVDSTKDDDEPTKLVVIFSSFDGL
jgi:hypothetical protein